MRKGDPLTTLRRNKKKVAYTTLMVSILIASAILLRQGYILYSASQEIENQVPSGTIRMALSPYESDVRIKSASVIVQIPNPSSDFQTIYVECDFNYTQSRLYQLEVILPYNIVSADISLGGGGGVQPSRSNLTLPNPENYSVASSFVAGGFTPDPTVMERGLTYSGGIMLTLNVTRLAYQRSTGEVTLFYSFWGNVSIPKDRPMYLGQSPKEIFTEVPIFVEVRFFPPWLVRETFPPAMSQYTIKGIHSVTWILDLTAPFPHATTLSLTLVSEPDLRNRDKGVFTSGVFISLGVGGFMGLIFEAARWVRPSNSKREQDYGEVRTGTLEEP
jgi:hypothetical protein